jgi:VWFA-related protein
MLCLALVSLLTAQIQEEEPTQLQSFRFSLVQVPLWVRDGRGNLVANLQAHQVTLKVDGQPVRIESFQNSSQHSLELVCLLDLSGSMGLGGKLEGSCQAITYLERSMARGDSFRLVVFADEQVLSLVDESNRHELPHLLGKARAYGKTALLDALSRSDTYFSPGSQGNRALVLFTDGIDNSSALSEEQLLAILRIVEVPVFAVGILDGMVPHEQASEEPLKVDSLRRISEASGGLLLLARSADDLPLLARSLDRHLRAHYLLAFTVERGSGEREHLIELQLRKNSYQLRHRKGYIGLSPEPIGGKR